jgi:S-adenosylmethionine decarboxylase
MKKATARLGGFSKERLTPARETNANVIPLTPAATAPASGPVPAPDHFVRANGVEYAGTHLLVELWGADAKSLTDCALIEKTLIDGAKASGATILHSYMHPFGPDMGVSGVVMLAESHISIHTWPERGYAALDLFMCGKCDPYKALPFLKTAFRPQAVQVGEQKRGVMA